MPTERLRLLFLNVGHFQTHFFLLVYPTAALALEHSGAGGYGDLVLPATAGFAGYAAGTLPAGWLGDRVSRHTLLVAMFLGLGGASLSLALLARTPVALAGALGLLGLAASIYHPVGIPMVAEGAAEGGTGRALAVNGVWGNLGVAAAPVVTASLAETFGWRAAFAMPGLVALLAGVGLWFCGGAPVTAPGTSAPSAAGIPTRDAARVILFLALGSLFGGVTFSVVTVVLPKAIDALAGGLLPGVTSAAGLAAGVFTVAAFAQLVSGRIIDRRPLRGLLLVLASGEMLACVLLAATHDSAAALALLPLTVFVFAGIPVYDAAAAGAVRARWRARLFALKYVISIAVSSAAVPLVAALYSPNQGFTRLFALLATCSFGLLLSSLLLPVGYGPARERATA